MAGHSKWANTKRRKAAVDAKRSALFTKLLREVQVAARMGGGSIEGNFRLKKAVDDAKALSVPSDNIERAIKRGSGDLEGEHYEEVTYEGYGPAGVALIVQCLTDNKNRTASEIRHAFTRNGGNLGGSNSVAYLFSERGVVTLEGEKATEEALMEAALECGAEDIIKDEDFWVIFCAPRDFQAVFEGVKKKFPDAEGELKLIPSTTTRVEGDEAKALAALLEMLEDLDDVQRVIGNYVLEEELQ